jgi:type IV secretion system protein VirB10
MSVFDSLRMGGERHDDETPSVAMPSRPWVLPMGLGAAVLLGGVVFWQLSDNRARIEEARLTDPLPGIEPSINLDGVPPAPDLFTLPLSAENALPIEDSVLPPPTPAAPPPDLENRLRSPALVVDLSTPGAPGAPASGVTTSAVTQALGGGAATRSADEDFASRLGVSRTDTSARAQRMGNQAYTVAEGTVIPAVLETAIHSDLPGYVRAVVSRDVRSFDNANVLVPRGSRLVGQYRAGVALGQSRAFVIWTRVIRPDGVSVDLGAPGTDALGRGGLEGRVDRHFLQRFGGAILLSLISAGTAIASDESDTQVIIASTSSAAGSAASVALESDLNIPPTVEVAQGAPIRVFVTRDLDFSILNEPE